MGHLHRRLIVFDLDGTVVDSRRDLATAANALVAERGGRTLSDDEVGGMVGEGGAVLVSRVLATAGLPPDPGALRRFLDIYDRYLLDSTVAYEGIEDALRAARSHAVVTLLTNKALAPTMRILDGLGLSPMFDDVTGGDGPLGRKPDPAALLAMARVAGASPEQTLLVGDSAIDFETAQGAGCSSCLALYGFSRHTLDSRQIAESMWVVQHPSELPAVFEEFATRIQP